MTKIQLAPTDHLEFKPIFKTPEFDQEALKEWSHANMHMVALGLDTALSERQEAMEIEEECERFARAYTTGFNMAVSAVLYKAEFKN